MTKEFTLTADGFSITLNTKKDLVYVTHSDGIRLPAEQGSKNDILMRKRLFAAGIGEKIVVENPTYPDAVATPRRYIEAQLVSDDRLMRDIDIDNFEKFSSIAPKLSTFKLWLEVNDVDESIQKTLLRNPELYKSKYFQTLNNEDLKRFVRFHLWGGDDFFMRDKPGVQVDYPLNVHRAIELIGSSWRSNRVVDLLELQYIKRAFPNVLNWNKIRINEFAHLVARNRESITLLMNSGTRMKQTKSAIKIGLDRKHKIIDQFKAISPDESLLWYFQWIFRGNTSPFAHMPVDVFNLRSDPSDIDSKGYKDFLFRAMEHASFDDSIELITNATPYFNAGVYGYDLITRSLEEQLDVDLVVELARAS